MGCTGIENTTMNNDMSICNRNDLADHAPAASNFTKPIAQRSEATGWSITKSSSCHMSKTSKFRVDAFISGHAVVVEEGFNATLDGGRTVLMLLKLKTSVCRHLQRL